MPKEAPHWYDKINPDKRGLRLVGQMRGMITLIREPDDSVYYLYLYATLMQTGSSAEMRAAYVSYSLPDNGFARFHLA